MKTSKLNKKIQQLLAGILLLCALSGSVHIFSSDAQAISFILSGGKNKEEPICVDDMIYIYVNGEAVFIDHTTAGCKGTFAIEAEEGALIEIDAIDNVGACRGITPVYIHRADCDSYDIITEGRQDGCQGFPGSMTPFLTATYIVDLKWLSCPDIRVTKMQCARTGGASLKIIGPDKQVITPDSSDYPAEIIPPGGADAEKVVFTLDEAQPDPAEDITYEATGWVKLIAAEGYYKLYDDKDITFGPGSREVTVTYGSQDILLPGSVDKASEVVWTFMSDSGDPASHSVAKELYFIAGKSLIHTRHRKEILYIACEIAAGLSTADEIRVALERGLYERYKLPTRYYTTPGCFDTKLWTGNVAGRFDLTKFLQTNAADCADMATMHLLTCHALGVTQEMMRIWKPVIFAGKGLAPVVNNICLGQANPPGSPVFDSSWHQVTIDYTKRNVYDPLMQFDNGTGGYTNPGGMKLQNYKKLFGQTIFIFDTPIALLGVD
jgi:hypothetical protein